VIVASPFLLRWREQRRIDAAMRAVVAAAPAAERTIEPRLSGGFRWAQFRGAQRGPDEQTDEETIARGSAADLYDEVGKSSTPAALHAKGVALVVLGDAGNAVDALTAATKARPDDSRAWSDLAAAHYMVAMQNAAIERQHLAAAIAAADRALTLDPKLDEARFNRALAIELLRPAEAKQAWSDYLKHDATSPWAAEVREKHLSDTQP
jgi:tetratricopeptide (TPR) repeat protein